MAVVSRMEEKEWELRVATTVPQRERERERERE